MNIKSFDLVIFDCDGVLVDSEPLANRVFVQIVRENGYDNLPNGGPQNGLNKFHGTCANILIIKNSFTIDIQGSSQKKLWDSKLK